MFSFETHRRLAGLGPASLLAAEHVLIPRGAGLHQATAELPTASCASSVPRGPALTHNPAVSGREETHTLRLTSNKNTQLHKRPPPRTTECSLRTNMGKEATAVKPGSYCVHTHTHTHAQSKTPAPTYMGVVHMQTLTNTHAHVHNQQYRKWVSCSTGILYSLSWLPPSFAEREYPRPSCPGPRRPSLQQLITGHFLHNHPCLPLL